MRKLYDALVADGSYTLSFEEFQKKYNNEQGSKDLHSALEKKGLIQILMKILQKNMSLTLNQ